MPPTIPILYLLTIDGHADTLCDGINTVTNDTIPVVSFDFDGATYIKYYFSRQLNDDAIAGIEWRHISQELFHFQRVILPG